jgi:GDP-D-mannose dehydratase
MLQADQAQDYVLSTNETHTVRSFVEKSFKIAGRTITWSGEGVNEVSVIRNFHFASNLNLYLSSTARANFIE